MKSFIRTPRLAGRPAGLLAATALAAIAAVGGTAGTAAGHGSAPAHYANKASHLRTEASVGDPQLEQGELAIEGTNRATGSRFACRPATRRTAGRRR